MKSDSIVEKKKDMNVKILPKSQFIRDFSNAALEYSRTPPLQQSATFGCLQIEKTSLPILVQSLQDGLRLSIFSKRWRDAKNMRSLDLDSIVNLVKEAIKAEGNP